MDISRAFRTIHWTANGLTPSGTSRPLCMRLRDSRMRSIQPRLRLLTVARVCNSFRWIVSGESISESRSSHPSLPYRSRCQWQTYNNLRFGRRRIQISKWVLVLDMVMGSCLDNSARPYQFSCPIVPSCILKRSIARTISQYSRPLLKPFSWLSFLY